MQGLFPRVNPHVIKRHKAGVGSAIGPCQPHDAKQEALQKAISSKQNFRKKWEKEQAHSVQLQQRNKEIEQQLQEHQKRQLLQEQEELMMTDLDRVTDCEKEVLRQKALSLEEEVKSMKTEVDSMKAQNQLLKKQLEEETEKYGVAYQMITDLRKLCLHYQNEALYYRTTFGSQVQKMTQKPQLLQQSQLSQKELDVIAQRVSAIQQLPLPLARHVTTPQGSQPVDT